MKDISGIDENGHPKNEPFVLFFKNGLVLVEANLTMERNLEIGRTFSITVRSSHLVATRMTGFLVNGSGFLKQVSNVRWAASMMMGKSMGCGRDSMPMVNAGTRAFLNMVKNAARGKFMMKKVS